MNTNDTENKLNEANQNNNNYSIEALYKETEELLRIIKEEDEYPWPLKARATTLKMVNIIQSIILSNGNDNTKKLFELINTLSQLISQKDKDTLYSRTLEIKKTLELLNNENDNSLVSLGMKVLVKDKILLIPNEYEKLDSMPEDPKDSIAYGKQTANAEGFNLIYPIDKFSSMPFQNKQEIINGIHTVLGEDQGLIEIEIGQTNFCKNYAYSIVKSKLNPSGMQYILTMHIDYVTDTICVQSFFSEKGMTGQRDSIVLDRLISEGEVTMPDLSNWKSDPYDKNYSRGLLMNLSELRKYDEQFPTHPLSEIRKFVDFIIKNN